MLQLVFGRAGFGKTTYVRDQIAAAIRNGQKRVLLLVPEQFSFVTGNTFLSLLGEAQYAALEITDFTRLAHEVKKQYGGAANPVLDQVGKAVLMSRAVTGVQEFLKLYVKKTNTASFVHSMLQMHTELKCCDIGFEQLLAAAEVVEKPILQQKLHDIALIMKAYDALIADHFLDSSDDLNRLYDTLLRIDYLKQRSIFIDGFDGFTAQEMKIIGRMLHDGARVTITLPCDTLHGEASQDFSLFANVRRTAMQLIQLAKKMQVSVAAPITLNRPHRFLSDDLTHLEANFLRPAYQSKADAAALSIYQAGTLYEECDFVCRTAKALLRTGQYRCRDIAIIARDLSTYQLPLEHAFRVYDLPYFEDERQPVDTQPLMQLVRYALRAVNSSFRSDDLFAYAKTFLTDVEMDALAELENYTFLWRISGKKWLSDFTLHPAGFAAEFTAADEAALQRINQTRRLLVTPLLRFKKQTESATGKEICTGIYQLLMDVRADKHLLKLAAQLEEGHLSALAEEQGRIWDLLMNLLDQIVLTIGDAPISPAEFAQLFELVLSFQDLGSIPQGLDNIIVGTAERTIADAPRVVFLLGLNEGAFPKTFSSTGLLNDSDRHILGDLDIALFSDTGRLTLQEKLIAYSAFTLPSEKLFLSYHTADSKGTECLPSSLIDHIKKLFPSLSIDDISTVPDMERMEGEQAAFELLSSRWEENTPFIASLKAYFMRKERYQDAVAAILRQKGQKEMSFARPELAKELFHSNMLVSASRVETYYHCPFQYFCKFGLGAKPRKVAEMDPMQTGTVMHYVLEHLLRSYGSEGLISLAPAERTQAVSRILEEYLVEKMGVAEEASIRFRYLFLRLEKTINLVVSHMVEEFSQSAFRTKAYELKIDRDAEVEPMLVSLPNGGCLAIRGSVDRVDVMEKDGKQYLRVVDYKSGAKEFSLSDVLHGLNMQMLIYLFCISETHHGEYADMIPCGVLYMPVRRSVSNLERGADAAAVQANAAKELKMKGMVLDDLDVLKGMERELRGRFIPVKSGKEITGSLISAEQLGKLADKIHALLAEMGAHLQAGSIPMYPVKGKNYEHTCEYCDYQTVCINRLEKKERTLFDTDHKEALAALEKGGYEVAELDDRAAECN